MHFQGEQLGALRRYPHMALRSLATVPEKSALLPGGYSGCPLTLLRRRPCSASFLKNSYMDATGTTRLMRSKGKKSANEWWLW